MGAQIAEALTDEASGWITGYPEIEDLQIDPLPVPDCN
jgi:hypothetical protein